MVQIREPPVITIMKLSLDRWPLKFRRIGRLGSWASFEEVQNFDEIKFGFEVCN